MEVYVRVSQNDGRASPSECKIRNGRCDCVTVDNRSECTDADSLLRAADIPYSLQLSTLTLFESFVSATVNAVTESSRSRIAGGSALFVVQVNRVMVQVYEFRHSQSKFRPCASS